MKIVAKLIFITKCGLQYAFFNSIEEATGILDSFEERLGEIHKSYSNRDDKVIFRFTACGAEYVLDLRECVSASLEDTKEWMEVSLALNINELSFLKGLREKAKEVGLEKELKEFSVSKSNKNSKTKEKI